MTSDRDSESTRSLALETTASLLDRVRSGDPAAREQLIERYLPAMLRWARGRLPAGARDLEDTDDLVQVTFLKALDKVKGFEYRGEGAFVAYLRRALQNRIRDAMRRAARRPDTEALTERLADHAPTPLEEAIGAEALMRYESALAELKETQQEAIVLRIELGFTYEEIARADG
ncbi:MAG: sigma-70 family RNA polymerase sigma factor, partial [Acidobacteriota bacterium]|nr:sigma-70 family RNA polymerase sigma factor [Acidobacteriota bacterium]